MPFLRFDKKTKKWIEIIAEEKLETDLFLNEKLRLKLDFAKKFKAKDNDVIGIVEGAEGSGKSNCAGNIMRYMSDDEFNPKLDMIGSDYDDAIDKISNVKKGGNLMFDEGNVFFLSTETTKREHRDLHKLFSIFRQKNLFVLIVLPSFFRLGTYFALDRSKFLIRTYTKAGVRGRFAYYGNKRKAELYKKGKAKYEQWIVEPNLYGRFTVCHLLESKEYKDFKMKTLLGALNNSKEGSKKGKMKSKAELKRDILWKIIKQNEDKKPEEISNIMGLTARRIRQIREEMETLKFPVIKA